MARNGIPPSQLVTFLKLRLQSITRQFYTISKMVIHVSVSCQLLQMCTRQFLALPFPRPLPNCPRIVQIKRMGLVGNVAYMPALFMSVIGQSKHLQAIKIGQSHQTMPRLLRLLLMGLRLHPPQHTCRSYSHALVTCAGRRGTTQIFGRFKSRRIVNSGVP